MRGRRQTAGGRDRCRLPPAFCSQRQDCCHMLASFAQMRVYLPEPCERAYEVEIFLRLIASSEFERRAKIIDLRFERRGPTLLPTDSFCIRPLCNVEEGLQMQFANSA